MSNLQQIFIDLGGLIREKRVIARISQDELAYRCSVHINCIWKIENAKSEIKLSTLIKIFHELDLSFDEIDKLLAK